MNYEETVGLLDEIQQAAAAKAKDVKASSPESTEAAFLFVQATVARRMMSLVSIVDTATTALRGIDDELEAWREERTGR